MNPEKQNRDEKECAYEKARESMWKHVTQHACNTHLHRIPVSRIEKDLCSELADIEKHLDLNQPLNWNER